MSSKTARIIYTKSGRGLQKDAHLLQLLLQQMGWCVVLEPVSSSYALIRLIYYWERSKIRLPKRFRRAFDQFQMAIGKLRPSRVDLQIHLENSFITYLGASKDNWLIPNQEWVKMHQLQYLPYLNRILCKTHAAVDAYTPLNTSVHFIGFSNTLAGDLPAFNTDAERFRRFLHVAGNNQKKGSAAVIEAWRRNPTWPNLDFVVERPERFDPIPENVTVWQSIPDEQLDALRRRSGVVLAPSEVEGFGHVILESMAWGSVTVTTDAEPMNELVGPDSGELVAWSRKEPCRLGFRYFVPVDALEASVDKLIHAPLTELVGLAVNARDWVEENHQRFESAFKDQLASIEKNA